MDEKTNQVDAILFQPFHPLRWEKLQLKILGPHQPKNFVLERIHNRTLKTWLNFEQGFPEDRIERSRLHTVYRPLQYVKWYKAKVQAARQAARQAANQAANLAANAAANQAVNVAANVAANQVRAAGRRQPMAVAGNVSALVANSVAAPAVPASQFGYEGASLYPTNQVHNGSVAMNYYNNPQVVQNYAPSRQAVQMAAQQLLPGSMNQNVFQGHYYNNGQGQGHFDEEYHPQNVQMYEYQNNNIHNNGNYYSYQVEQNVQNDAMNEYYDQALRAGHVHQNGQMPYVAQAGADIVEPQHGNNYLPLPAAQADFQFQSNAPQLPPSLRPAKPYSQNYYHHHQQQQFLPQQQQQQQQQHYANDPIVATYYNYNRNNQGNHQGPSAYSAAVQNYQQETEWQVQRPQHANAAHGDIYNGAAAAAVVPENPSAPTAYKQKQRGVNEYVLIQKQFLLFMVPQTWEDISTSPFDLNGSSSKSFIDWYYSNLFKIFKFYNVPGFNSKPVKV